MIFEPEQEAKFSDLLGLTLTKVYVEKDEENNDTVVFVDTNSNKYVLYHYQECCENVYIEDVVGDLSDLIGSPITMAEKTSNRDNTKNSYI